MFLQNTQAVLAVCACIWGIGRKEKTVAYLLDSLRLRVASFLLDNRGERRKMKKNATHTRAVGVSVRAWYVKPRHESSAGDSLAHVFPRFVSATRIFFEFWLVHCIVCVLCYWLEWFRWFWFNDTHWKPLCIQNAASELIIPNWPEWRLDNLLCLVLWLDE